jgi:hypothetical protein
MLNRLGKWHQTKAGYLAVALVELGLAYAFVSLAIDRGNLLYYLLSLIFLIGFLQNLFKLIGAFAHGKRQSGKARRR